HTSSKRDWSSDVCSSDLIPRSNQHSEREQNLPDDSETAGRIRAAVQLSDPAFATPTHSPHPPQLLSHNGFQPRRLLELSEQLPRQALDLLLDGFPVVLLGRRAHITTRRQRVVGVLDLGERRRVAEA